MQTRPSQFSRHIDHDGPILLSVYLQPTVLGKILLDYESSNNTVTQILAQTMQESAVEAVRRFRPNITQSQLARVYGSLIATNTLTGTQRVFGDDSVSRSRLKISDLRPGVFQELIQAIHQSNDDIEFRDLRWIYKFNNHSMRVGGAGVKNIPKRFWGGKVKYAEVWKQHSDDQGDISCAAFAISYAIANKKERERNKVPKQARDLMTKMGWGPEISVEEMGDYVKVHKDKKLIVLMEGEREAVTYEGENYTHIYKPGTDDYDTVGDPDLVHIVYIPDLRHFICLDGFSSLLQKKRNWVFDRFCYKCNFCYNRYKNNCRCDMTEEERNARLIKRRKKQRMLNTKCECGTFGCDKKECRISCGQCKQSMKRGQKFSHRCLVVTKDQIKEFWRPGDDESGKDPKTKLWFYDIESSLVTIPGETINTFKVNYTLGEFEMTEEHEYIYDEVVRSKHRPTLVMARNVFEPKDTPIMKWKGENALLDFVKFMVTHNDGHNYCFAHNAQGYDSRLIVTICNENYQDEDVRIVSSTQRGNKYLELAVRNCRFRDTMCFLVGSLANLYKSFFPTSQVKKGDFPHQFNRPENYGYVGDVPPIEAYGKQWSSKSQKEHEAFVAWHTQESITKKGCWNFEQELESYCENDVNMGNDLMLEFHNICMEKAPQGTSIASPWMRVTAPSWVHKTIMSTIYPTLELESFTNTNSQEYREHVANLTKNETWTVLVDNEYWFARLALRGGRTEVRKVYHQLSEQDLADGKLIVYIDVVSLYPGEQLLNDYPVGTPTIYVHDRDFYPCYMHRAPAGGNVWRHSCQCDIESRKQYQDERIHVVESYYQRTAQDILNDPEFFGVVCVSLTPPRTNFHPTLVQYDERLNKSVASLEKIDKGVFTSVELVEALKDGYRLDKIHRYDKYKRKPGLWNDFIKQLYIDKMANAGSTPPREEWDDLIEEYETKFKMGGMLKASLEKGWGKNPAKKQTAKICINSGWGKHCQRPNMPEVAYTASDDLESLMKLDKNFSEGTYNLLAWDYLGGSTRTVFEHNGTTGRIDLHGSYLPAAIFVPAYGRLKLMSELRKLGDRVLMHDTDSIIYVYDPKMYNTPESTMLGEWEREDFDKDNGGIKEFVGLGPKSYALRTMNDKTLIKNKGVSIKHAHSSLVNFYTVRKLVLDYLNGDTVVPLQVPQMRFMWSQTSEMETQEYLKRLTFSPYNLKGDLDKETGILYPFGYNKT